MSVPTLVARAAGSRACAQVLITTDDVASYRRVELPEGVEVWDRDRHRRGPGAAPPRSPGSPCSIHDQRCAAEKRRDRKRGKLRRRRRSGWSSTSASARAAATAATSQQLPVGAADRHRVGSQDAHRPELVQLRLLVHEGRLPELHDGDAGRGQAGGRGAEAQLPRMSGLPNPERLRAAATCAHPACRGIGGTGVVTVSQIARHGGDARRATTCAASTRPGCRRRPARSSATCASASASRRLEQGRHRRGRRAARLRPPRRPAATRTCPAPSPDRTVVDRLGRPRRRPGVDGAPPRHAPIPSVVRASTDAIEHAPRPTATSTPPATADGLFGDDATANVFLLGIAVQAGACRCPPSTMEQAIELNGVAVERNLAAFRWGRQLGGRASRRPGRRRPRALPNPAETTDELVERLAADLVRLPVERYAKRFRGVVDRVRVAEAGLGDSRELTETVARHLHKLMAYKDEYEVARLLAPAGVDRRRRGRGRRGGDDPLPPAPADAAHDGAAAQGQAAPVGGPDVPRPALDEAVARALVRSVRPRRGAVAGAGDGPRVRRCRARADRRTRRRPRRRGGADRRTARPGTRLRAAQADPGRDVPRRAGTRPSPRGDADYAGSRRTIRRHHSEPSPVAARVSCGMRKNWLRPCGRS